MGKYLLRTDAPAFETKLDREISQLVESIIRYNGKKISAIFLIGSLSKGEGTVEKKGTTFRMLSDIDVLVVRKSPFPNLNLNNVKKVVLGRGTSVSQISLNKVKTLPSNLETLDLKLYGKLLWGKCPKIDLDSNIPSGTAYEILTKRCEFFVDNIPFEEKNNSWDNYVLAKIIQGCFDALMIHQGLYVSSKVEKLKVSKKILKRKFQQTYGLSWQARKSPENLKSSTVKFVELAHEFQKFVLEKTISQKDKNVFVQELYQNYGVKFHPLSFLTDPEGILKGIQTLIFKMRHIETKAIWNFFLFSSIISLNPFEIDTETLNWLENYLKVKGLLPKTIQNNRTEKWFELREILRSKFNLINVKV